MSLLKSGVSLPEILKPEQVDEAIVRARDIRARQNTDKTMIADGEADTEDANEVLPENNNAAQKYEHFVRNLTPQKWLKIIRSATNAKMFTKDQISLLRRLQKMSGRGMRPKPDQITKASEILQTLAENRHMEDVET